jgi:hypothetical protein
MLTTAAAPAAAEWYADLYGGGSFTNNTNDTQESSLGVTLTALNLKVDPSFTVGIALAIGLKDSTGWAWGSTCSTSDRKRQTNR